MIDPYMSMRMPVAPPHDVPNPLPPQLSHTPSYQPIGATPVDVSSLSDRTASVIARIKSLKPGDYGRSISRKAWSSPVEGTTPIPYTVTSVSRVVPVVPVAPVVPVVHVSSKPRPTRQERELAKLKSSTGWLGP
jgi:hypothetical protein